MKIIRVKNGKWLASYSAAVLDFDVFSNIIFKLEENIRKLLESHKRFRAADDARLKLEIINGAPAQYRAYLEVVTR